MSERGVAIVAYGHPARACARRLLRDLRRYHDWPALVLGDEPLVQMPDLTHAWEWQQVEGGWGGRAAKISLLLDPPFDQTLYLDADTRLHGDVAAGFSLLADGWELAMAPSRRQGADVMGHLAPDERAATLERWGADDVLALQAGVMYFRRCEAVRALGEAWRREWQAAGGRLDQGALLRALLQTPVRLWLLGRPWNGGALVEHLFGAARSKEG